jgi:hypothetical protein
MWYAGGGMSGGGIELSEGGKGMEDGEVEEVEEAMDVVVCCCISTAGCTLAF